MTDGIEGLFDVGELLNRLAEQKTLIEEQAKLLDGYQEVVEKLIRAHAWPRMRRMRDISSIAPSTLLCRVVNAARSRLPKLWPFRLLSGLKRNSVAVLRATMVSPSSLKATRHCRRSPKGG